MMPFLTRVGIFSGLEVEAEGVWRALQYLCGDDRTFLSGIRGELADRRGERLAHNLNAGLLVAAASPVHQH
jgi:hypothetical protein